MRLRDLEAEFIKRVVTPNVPTDIADADFEITRKSHVELRDRIEHHPVETLAEADGVWFLCPKCFAANGGKRGTHMVLCWFVGKVPDDAQPKPGRWNPAGSSLDDLTFVGPGAASVLLLSDAGCQWHGFVKNGDAT